MQIEGSWQISKNTEKLMDLCVNQQEEVDEKTSASTIFHEDQFQNFENYRNFTEEKISQVTFLDEKKLNQFSHLIKQNNSQENNGNSLKSLNRTAKMKTFFQEKNSSLHIQDKRVSPLMFFSQQNYHSSRSNSDDDVLQEKQCLCKKNTDEKQEKYFSKYEELEEIARGFQGSVKLVRNINSQIKYAAKIYENKQEDEELVEAIRNEYNLLKNLHHKNIVKVIEIIETQFQTILIMEYVEGIPLSDLKYKNLDQSQKLKIIEKILKTIKYIHSNNIIHRDISNKNILYNEESASIKLIDFGIAKKYQNQEKNLTPTGNPEYLSPELIQGSPYTEKVDIFQVGCLAYELFEQKEQIRSIHLIKRIKKNQLSFKITENEQIQNLILKMLFLDYEQRISENDSLEIIQKILL